MHPVGTKPLTLVPLVSCSTQYDSQQPCLCCCHLNLATCFLLTPVCASVSKGDKRISAIKGPQSACFSDGEFLPVVDTLCAFTCLTESFLHLLLFVRRFGSPRNLNVTHGCARSFTLHVSPVPCLAHINIPVSLSHE